jgi:hypothetical protein
MMLIDDPTIRAVHAAHARGGDLAAAVELRERFPGLAGNVAAMDCVRRILQMQPGMDEIIAARVAAAKQVSKAKRSRGYVIRWT